MEKVSVNNTGKVIHCFENNYNRRIHDLERYILPAVTEIIQNYKGLDIGEITQDFYEDLINNGIKKAEYLYSTKVESYAESLLPHLRESVLRDWQKPLLLLQESISQYQQKVIRIYEHNAMDPNGISPNYFVVENGKVALNKEVVRRDYEITITNDTQSEVYDRLEKFQNQYHGLIAFLKEKGLDFDRFSVIGRNGLLQEVDDEQLAINSPVLVTAF